MIRIFLTLSLVLHSLISAGCAGMLQSKAGVSLSSGHTEPSGLSHSGFITEESNSIENLRTNHTLLIDPTFSSVAVFSMTEGIPRSETTLLGAPIPGLSRHSTFDLVSSRPSALPRFSESIFIHDLETGVKFPLNIPHGSKVTSPAWSPDGSMLAFIIEKNRNYEIWVGSRETGETRQISSEPINMFLWGQYSRRIDSASPELPFVPYQWAPQSDKIYYSIRTEKDPAVASALYQLLPKAEVRATNNVLDPRNDSEESFQKVDRKPLAKALFLSNIVASSVRYSGTYKVISPERNFTGMTISPDGTMIVGITTDYDADEVFHEVYKMSAVEGATDYSFISEISISPQDLSSLVWGTGDGQLLYTLSDNANQYCIQRYDLTFDSFETVDCLKGDVFPTDFLGSTLGSMGEFIVLTASDGQIRSYDRQTGTLTAAVAFPEMDEDYFWSPLSVGAGQSLATGRSSKTILLGGHLKRNKARRNSSFAAVVSLDISTGETSQLWSREYSQQDWLYSQFADSAGNVYYSKETVVSPRNLFRLDIEESLSAQITHFEDPFPIFSDYQTKILSYNRDDGVPLSARLILPNADPGSTSKLPLLVWQYPGTSVRAITERFRDGMFVRPNRHKNAMGRWLPLAMLERGYAVLYPDIPLLGIDGETEYVSYVEQTIAGAQAAVDAAVDTGLIDRSRIAISGSSFGGHTTILLLAHTDIFAAGVSSSGVAHWLYRPNSMQYESRSYWEHPKVYFERSPVLLAPEIKEPILLIHGLNDERPPASQSITLFNAMRSLNGTAKLILLENEGHTIKILENQQMVLAATANWLDKFLKDNLADNGSDE